MAQIVYRNWIHFEWWNWVHFSQFSYKCRQLFCS